MRRGNSRPYQCVYQELLVVKGKLILTLLLNEEWQGERYVRSSAPLDSQLCEKTGARCGVVRHRRGRDEVPSGGKTDESEVPLRLRCIVRSDIDLGGLCMRSSIAVRHCSRLPVRLDLMSKTVLTMYELAPPHPIAAARTGVPELIRVPVTLTYQTPFGR